MNIQKKLDERNRTKRAVLRRLSIKKGTGKTDIERLRQHRAQVKRSEHPEPGRITRMKQQAELDRDYGDMKESLSSHLVYDRMAEMLVERNLLKDAWGVTKGAVKGAWNLGKGMYHGATGARLKRGDRPDGVIGNAAYYAGKGVGSSVRGVGSLGASLVRKTADKGKSLTNFTPSDSAEKMANATATHRAQAKEAERKAEREPKVKNILGAMKDSELKKSQAEAEQRKTRSKDILSSLKTAKAEPYSRDRLTQSINRVRRKKGERADIMDKYNQKQAERQANVEKGRKLVDYESEASDSVTDSVSYRDIMLQRIAEIKLAERLPKGENINEWVFMIPWAIRAAQLGLGAYRAYKGARAVGAAVNAGRAAYGASRALGTGRAVAQGVKAGGRSLLGSAAKEGGKYGATQAADNALGVSGKVKRYVAGQAIKDLAPDVSNVVKGVGAAYSGASKAGRFLKSGTGSKKKEEDPSEKLNRSYSTERGYPEVGDDDSED
jgi:hypothetical protein